MTSALWIGLFVASALAEDPTCPADGGWLDGHQHLRALFLDLRGEVPDPDDYANLLSEDGEVPRGVVEQLVASRPFAERAVRFHQSLFWNDLSEVRLLSNTSLMSIRNGIYFIQNRANLYRGAPNRHCGTAQARFDENGDLVVVTNADGSISEGWVEIAPYWDSNNPIPVCAFDAQEVAFSPGGTDCSTTRAFADAGCGCGPNLQWCGVGFEEPRLTDAFERDLDRRVERMVERDDSWLTLLTSSRGFVNGPMVSFYRHRTQLPQGIHFREAAVNADGLPDLTWEDEDQWVEVDLGPQHSGVLTSPAFLIRFQTARARANQYHQSFLCEPLSPPDGGLTALDDPDPTLDLTAREGCQYCHALLEPTAAYWGRWTQFGAGYLDPETFPPFSETCARCAADEEIDCPDSCEDYYMVRPLAEEQAPFVGYLGAYEFLEERHFTNVEQGPRRLVNQHDLDGRLPRCTAKKTAEWLLGRELTGDDEPWLQDLATKFANGGYRWRGLVRDIVLSDAYRSVE